MRGPIVPPVVSVRAPAFAQRALLVILLALGTTLAATPLAGQGTESPHGAAVHVPDCGACHTPDSWRSRPDARFSHDRDAGFPLAGAHAAVECRQCHLDLRFDEPRARPDDCASCHLDVHQGRLGPRCVECHDTDGFEVPAARAHARTTFPLTGAHVRVPCEGCHVGESAGRFTRVGSACLTCHERDYLATTFPDHALLGYGTDCASCHGTASWRGARFDHDDTGFALLGAHRRVACAVCHTGPAHEPAVRPASQDDCVACHRRDYDRRHAGTGFPTTCASCHGVNGWGGARFDHAGFPIFSGRHRGEWRSCADCHPTPQDYAVFRCTTCHTRSDSDDRHDDVSGYVYDSVRCLACHPTGED